jgi:hypothetical protein
VIALDVCEYDLTPSDSTSGTSGSTSGNANSSANSSATTGGRRLSQALRSPVGRKLQDVVAQKRTWNDATKKLVTYGYSEKTCSNSVGTLEEDLSGCFDSGEGTYIKLDSYNDARGTASECDHMHSLFLVPLYVFLGVSKMML